MEVRKGQVKCLRKFYWAIESKLGTLMAYQWDTPTLFASKPWVSKELGEKAVKVKVVRVRT